MLYPETRQELEKMTGMIGPGQCLEVKGTFRTFWPNPRWPNTDDHLEPEERARRWLAARGMKGRENFERGTITIERTENA